MVLLATIATAGLADQPSSSPLNARITAVAAPGMAMPPAVALVAGDTTELTLRLQPLIEAELQRVGIMIDEQAPARLEFRTRVRQLPAWRPPFTITNADHMNRHYSRPAVEVPMPEFGPSSPEGSVGYALYFTLAEAGRPVVWRAVGEVAASGRPPLSIIGALVPPLIAQYGHTATQKAVVVP